MLQESKTSFHDLRKDVMWNYRELNGLTNIVTQNHSYEETKTLLLYFQAKLSIDEVRSYQEDTNHTLYCGFQELALKQFKKGDHDQLLRPRWYASFIIQSTADSICVCQISEDGKIARTPEVIPTTEIDSQSDYRFSTFSAQLLLPLLPNEDLFFGIEKSLKRNQLIFNYVLSGSTYESKRLMREN